MQTSTPLPRFPVTATTEALRALTVGDVTLEVTARIGVIALDEPSGENEH